MSTRDSLALEFAEACSLARHGPNKLYESIRTGLLKARKVGRKTIILRSDLEAYLISFPRSISPKILRRRDAETRIRLAAASVLARR